MKSYYIKERVNPQTGTYFVLKGQLTKKEVKKEEESIYGTNIMHEYKTNQDYNAAINTLLNKNEKIY